MKHHFLIQVHKHPDLLGRILQRLSASDHYFHINIDEKCSTSTTKDFEKILGRIDQVVSITRHNVMHGGFSQIACTIEQMKRVVQDFPEEGYLHTISGQDYPCVSMREFDKFFENNTKSYLRLDSHEEATEWRNTKYRSRLERWRFMDVFNHGLLLRMKTATVLEILTRRIRRPYPSLSEVWGGWNWFSLYLDTVAMVLNDFVQDPKYLKRFRYTYCADELIFSTYFQKNAHKFNIELSNCLRFVEWHPTRPHTNLPLILNENEYESIRNSGAFFCRKVEPYISDALMNKLDERIEQPKITD